MWKHERYKESNRKGINVILVINDSFYISHFKLNKTFFHLRNLGS